MTLFSIDSALCRRCGLCQAACPASLVRTDSLGYPVPLAGKEGHCIRCGHCAAVCPSGAFRHELLPPEMFAPYPKRVKPETIAAFMRSRRSMRRYKPEPLPREMIERVLELASYAPNGHNTQSVEWVVVADRAGVEAVCAMVVEWSKAEVERGSQLAAKLNLAGAVRAYSRGKDVISRGAPHLVLAHAPAQGITPREDAVTAVAHLELAAHGLGLGSCYAGYVGFAAKNHPSLARMLGLPEDRVIYAAAMLGKPALKYRLIPPRRFPRIAWVGGPDLAIRADI